MIVTPPRSDAAPPPRRHARATTARRIVPRPRLLVATTLLVLLASVLMVRAYAAAALSPDGLHTSSGKQGAVPAEIVGGGPIINTARGGAQSYRLPEKTIALTFDDGPDPWWTPKVLRTLAEHDVDATFFVVGSGSARHPDLVRQVATEGHELGVHTFTHPDLTRMAGWQRRIEYSQTQMAIASATGVKTSLIRFPYSSHAYAIDDENWPLYREAGDLGYLPVLNDTDSKDWARPGVEQIIKNSTPEGTQGAIILFHDAGGDRAQTVAALDRFIPMMKERGYRFVTVSQGLTQAMKSAAPAGNATARTEQAASDGEIWRGSALVWVIRIADTTVDALGVLFVIAGALTLIRTLLMLVLAGRHARKRRAKGFRWGPEVTAPVSVIVPAYNEKEGIEAAVRSLAGGDYPHIEVVVVDDGSSDETAALAEGLGLPNVRVVRIPNGGKPNALNTGVAFASHDLIVMVDGDTIFEPDSIRRLVQPFADPTVGAVAGNVKVGNRNSLVARWQHIEYVIGFNLDRRLYETLRCMPTVPGAIGAFRRQALRQAGGMSDETLAEDTDVTMAFLRNGWHVVYEENARAWTEAPAKLSQLWKQRYRWSYGTMQAMWKHRKALVESGPSGRFGRVGLPILALFGVTLPLLAPVIDLLTLYGLLFLGRTETVIAWFTMLVMQIVTAMVAFRLDRESMRPLWTLPLQQFAYRQLMYLVLIQSAVTALTGARLRWHKLQRTGDALVGTAPRDRTPVG
ncbi:MULTISPECIES: bifunctional polysaccharide deacetylase/glycosyltransferase family 2 protein [Catenuloplanes]|uniref:Cellulose synthase/poly-beta-1,6-N-acetylglucosamine synthase-like glycosyltransferase/peptidoglycan/xylan/chitin deacetylase (PgdA/CDA1 family) n=1 Tax=Catenuloplanes niger TaxID=587534 RepID=A0AAE4CV74_9ACTN|nr:glycosyltransferase [Catenuloplanes niger]MDR7324193.1 cellulose synthase/poly-beta-1,6-N-acetylglucosamine synthase-like glycosyltransferase/peptidoglycan/xylan/chitin deacetylase (PgdA/CDA1 family) [Catenuloplanes niger]